MAKKQKKDKALSELIDSAPREILSELILELASENQEIRRECFDFLKSNISVSEKFENRSEGEAVMFIWDELLPDLEDLDDYGGGDYDVEDKVSELLDDITERLKSKKVDEIYRRKILDYVLPFIESRNSGMADALDEVAFASCYSDSELRYLAQRLEAMNDSWQTSTARDIYRQIGDHEKYLELRLKYMEYGADYLDLATFYQESGENDKAETIAKEGLSKGKGRMDELRAFVAELAQKAGDQKAWIKLHFEQTIDDLTLEQYINFKQMCTVEEWEQFQPEIIKKLKFASKIEQMKIHRYRNEDEKVINILVRCPYPDYNWEDCEYLQLAEQLEKLYPEKILTWYISGLGDLSSSRKREEYAIKAEVMAKVRHMLLDVINDKDKWKKLALNVKNNNLRRPAFQQEFTRIVPGWEELK